MIFKELLIDKDETIIEAIKKLDKTAKKILFVTNNNKLFGSLTDGDIRRFILKNGAVDGKVEFACYKNPKFFYNNYSIDKIINTLNLENLIAIPIVNNNNEIIEIILNNDEIIENNNIKYLDIPVVIMAGGFGTRLDPITKIIPKPLIPINDKSIIEIIIDKFSKYGINKFYISINYKAYLIKSYISEINLSYEIKYIEEDKPLGTIGSLYMIKDKIESKYFILTNCDIIIDSNYYDIVKFHKEKKADLTIVSAMQNYKIPYGICNIKEGGELLSIEEKPEINFLFNTGMYIINTELLQEIPENTFFHTTDLINILKSKNKKVLVYPINNSSWLDIGEWSEYKKTINRFKN